MVLARKSYMDETGINRNDPYCTIAGYVGDVNEWDKFDHDWRFVLGQYMRDVPEDRRYFHAYEFYHGDKKFSGWKAGKRKSFIEALFGVINRYDLSLFSSTIDVKVFFSMTEDERHWLTGGIHNGIRWTKEGAPSKQYFMPFHHCVIQSADFVPVGGKVFPIMSRQDHYKIKALELYERMLTSDPPLDCRDKLADDMVFSDPKKTPALQAADLSTYWIGVSMTYVAETGDTRHLHFPHMLEMSMVLKSVRRSDDLKLFNLQGMMLLLQGANRYIRTSFPTLDQQLPSLPVAQRREILSAMRQVNFRQFLDQWTPGAQASHG